MVSTLYPVKSTSLNPPFSHYVNKTLLLPNFNKVENWGKTYKALISYDYTVFSIVY